jgi:MFS transporter, FHS family, glucose/mannose:H+ symporter
MVTLPINIVPDSTSITPLAQTPPIGTGRSRTLPVVLCYFLVGGVATVMLGPALPLLAVRWGMPDARLGSLFVAYFAGQFCGAWLATPRLRASLVFGAIVAACGMAVLAFANATTAQAALFLTGLGLSAGLTAGNVVVGTLDCAASTDPPKSENFLRRSSRARDLAWLNFAWGLGAIACPLLLNLSLRVRTLHAQPGAVFFAALAVALGLAGVVLALFLPRSSREELFTAKAAKHLHIPWPLFALFGASFMLYIGVENSLGGWLPSYAQRLSPGSLLGERAAALALCFWICELAGRGLMAVVIERLRDQLVYRVCLTVLILAAALLAFIPHPGTVAIFAVAAVLGLSLAPIYPLAVSFLLARTGNHPRVGKVFACASLGGTLLPWLTGVTSTHFQSLRIGFAVPAAGAMLMLMLSLYLPRASSHDLPTERP